MDALGVARSAGGMVHEMCRNVCRKAEYLLFPMSVYVAPNRRFPITHRRRVISQKNGMLSYTVATISRLAQCYFYTS